MRRRLSESCSGCIQANARPRERQPVAQRTYTATPVRKSSERANRPHSTCTARRSARSGPLDRLEATVPRADGKGPSDGAIRLRARAAGNSRMRGAARARAGRAARFRRQCRRCRRYAARQRGASASHIAPPAGVGPDLPGAAGRATHVIAEIGLASGSAGNPSDRLDSTILDSQ